MVAKDRTIRSMRIVILLESRVVLCMLLLVTALVLEVVHHRHSPSTRPAIGAAMLPLLVALSEHSVEIVRWGVRIWRSRWGGGVS